MIYNKTTKSIDWYNIETRNIRADELYDLYTAVGDNILTAIEKIAQIILFRHAGSVQAYFISYADQDDTNSVFDSRVETVTEYPLRTWLQNNNPHSAYRMTTEYSSTLQQTLRIFIPNEIEFPKEDPDELQTVLDRVISKLESKDETSLISITIAPNYLQDNKETEEDQYFCRPVEIVATDDPVRSIGEQKPVLSKFTAMHTEYNSFHVKECAVDDAIKTIAYGKIEYRGDKSIPLDEDGMRSVLGRNKNNYE